MKIEKISRSKVKIELSFYDLKANHISYKQLDCNDPDTKRFISLLVQNIRQKVDIDLSTSRLFIEAFEQPDGGCILYISSMPDRSLSDPFRLQGETRPRGQRYQSVFESVVGEFDSIDAVSQLCLSLYSNYSHLVHKSHLYLYRNRYRLVVETMSRLDKKLEILFNEYGRFTGRGVVHKARTAEYGSLIVADCAVERLVEVLC